MTNETSTNETARAEFLATCDADERAEAEALFALIDEANDPTEE